MHQLKRQGSEQGDKIHRATATLILALAILVSATVQADEKREILIRRTSDNIRYGLIGTVDNLQAPAPTLMIFAHSIETMQQQPVYSEVASLLSPLGWVSVIIEPPCHGEDARPDEPPQLMGWRYRIEHDEDLLKAFHTRASAVLDRLITDKISDPARVAVCGTSRGGFLAFHFAAAEPRVKAAAGISPVTRLMALREFSSLEQRNKADRLDLAILAQSS